MKITILMAHYKLSPYIKKAIQSVIDQKNPNWKLIICDDCSGDEEYSYIQSLIKDPRIKLIKNEVNLGYIGTLKRLIDEADTEIVGILNADDALTKNAVNLVLKAYESRPEIGFTYSDIYRCGINLIPQGIKRSKQIDKKNSHIHKQYIDHFKTFKKSVYYASGGYDEKYIYAGDHDLAYKLEESSIGLYIEKPLYFHRALYSSQSRDPIKKQRGILSHVQAMIAAVERRKDTDTPSLNQEELRDQISKIRFAPTKPILSFKNKPLRYIKVYLKFSIFDRMNKLFTRLFGDKYTQTMTFIKDYFYLLRDIKELLLLNLGSSKKQTKKKKKTNEALSVTCVLCHSKKFAFVCISKNASSYLLSLTIENDWNYPSELNQAMIHKLTGFHADGELRIERSEMKDLDDSFLRFAVYRDPVERALSFYKEKIHNRGGPQFISMIDAVDHPGTRFDKFIQFLKDNSKDFSTEHTDPHIVPQALCLENSTIDYLVPIEQLNLFLEEKRGIAPRPAQNKSHRESGNFMDTVKQEDIDVIKEIYKDDYKLLEIYKDKVFSKTEKEVIK